MSIPASQARLLRAAFETCRPRSSLRLRRGNSLIPRYSQTRNHSSESATPFTPSPSSSVSQDEVSHFSRLASSWWDPYGPSRLLHLMNPLRHDFISTCFRSDPGHDLSAERTYLDIGCGGGIFASSAARKPHTKSVTAIDPTPEVIAVAKAQQRSDPALAEPKLTYLNCAIEDLTSQTSVPSNTSPSNSTSSSPYQYDIISLFEVIEHIDTPSTFLQTALTHLKPGGWLIGSTISRHPISYLTTKLIAEAPIIGVVPQGTHDWNKYIKPGEIKSWFAKQQSPSEPGVSETLGDAAKEAFGPVRIQGVVYVPMLGWRLVNGSEEVGNYFFGVQKLG